MLDVTDPIEVLLLMGALALFLFGLARMNYERFARLEAEIRAFRGARGEKE